MQIISTVLFLLYSLQALKIVSASSKDKPHGHKGVLEPYTGKLLPFKVSGDQNKKLEKGQPVSVYSYEISAVFTFHDTVFYGYYR